MSIPLRVLIACSLLAAACSSDNTAPPQPTTPAAGSNGSGSDGAAGTSSSPVTTGSSSPSAGTGAVAGATAGPGRDGGAAPQAGSPADAGALDAGSAGSAGSAADGGGAGSAGGEAGASDPDAGAPDAATSPVLPPVANTDGDGPFMSMQDLRGGPRGQSGVFQPTELGKDGLKHPVFVWGCGGGSTPSSYADQLRRVASHGFVVIAEVSQIGDNGAPLKASIDWIIAENTRDGSPFFGKIETSKIALGGHSIGSVNSFLVAADRRLTTTIHVAGGSLDNVNDPRAPTTGMGGKSLIHPVAYICSMSDTFGNVEKTEKDYENTTVPAFITVMSGVDHIAAARSGLPATIAWLRWHLAGEVDRRSAFLEPNGRFTSGIFVSRNKNW